jgi:hypothetical protein
MRWAGPDDYPALRALAEAWFPAETLIDPTLYRHLLGSGTVRVRVRMGDQGPAGYYALWPLTAAAYASLKSGEKRERDLGVGDIVSASDPRARVLYISDVCARPDAAGGAPGLVVLKDLQRSLVDLLRGNPQIAHVAAWAFSAEGARLAARLGLRPVADGTALVEIAAAALDSRLVPAVKGIIRGTRE